jgi:hypothetical protein
MIKKAAVMLLLFLSANAFAEYKNSVVLKFGVTPYSQLISDIEYSKVFDVRFPDEKRYNYPNIGTILYVEYYRKLYSGFNLGVGVSQQLYRGGVKHGYPFLHDEELGICFTSFYLSPKLKIYNDLYLNLHFGFNKLWMTETELVQFNRDSIGLYYSLGVSYEYKNFIFEFLYSRNYAKHESDFLEVSDASGNGKIMVMFQKETYETFNFNIGYKFDFNFPDIKREKKEPKNIKAKEKKKSEKELLIEQNELLKKQIELLQQKNN